MAAIDFNKELFDNYINDANKPVLVDFWAPWCVYCRRIAPESKAQIESFIKETLHI